MLRTKRICLTLVVMTLAVAGVSSAQTCQCTTHGAPLTITGGPDALVWNNGRLTTHWDALKWKRHTFGILLDSDNNQIGGSFRIYNDVEVSAGAQAIVQFSVENSDSWINHGGDLGVGTDSPQAKLDVNGDGRFNGTLTSKEVMVTQDGWPDFVFEDDYQLMPLAELEQRIRTDGHLPGIPSADEAAEQGVGLGEVQAKLLLKIEELTLYMLELKKENNELTSRLDLIEGSK